MLPNFRKSTFLFSALSCCLLLCFIGGCGFRREMPQHRDKVEVGRDAQGRVVYKKFDQLIDDYYGRSLASITQTFDTTGRLVEEFGTDHPRLGKQYLFEIFYGEGLRVVNYFRWPKIDTADPEILPPSAFVEQKIFVDTSSLNKIVLITKLSVDKKDFVGRYVEIVRPVQAGRGVQPTVHSFRFVLPLHKFAFDSQQRLVLEGVKKLDY